MAEVSFTAKNIYKEDTFKSADFWKLLDWWPPPHRSVVTMSVIMHSIVMHLFISRFHNNTVQNYAEQKVNHITLVFQNFTTDNFDDFTC